MTRPMTAVELPMSTRSMLVVLTLVAGPAGAACDGAEPLDGNVADASPDVVACGFGSTTRYLPFEVGFTWEFRVTDPATGAVDTKGQAVVASENHPCDGLPVLVQITSKWDGERVESWFRREGDAIVRLRQIDYDERGEKIRTQIFTPPRLRLDESPSRIASGAQYIDTYTATELDGSGQVIDSVQETDQWTVVDADLACSTPMGEHRCLQVRRLRLRSGSVKEYSFVRGVGKVREEGGQLEQLVGCGVQ
jgi:hypothetical protein